MSQQAPIPHPPFDPAYQTPVALAGLPPDLDVNSLREGPLLAATAEPLLSKYTNLKHREVLAPPVQGLSDHTVTISLFETKTSKKTDRAVFLYCHGGGQVGGNRFFGVEVCMDTVLPVHDDLVFASVEYRLAPENRAPAAAYDCYAATVYIADHAAELGIDPSRIVISGLSGGGAPAAAACILARDRKYPPIRAQLLSTPMLDDRVTDVSHRQFPSGATWPAVRNSQAWDLVLGPDRAAPSDIQVPGRAQDLSNLPPAFIDVGECEVFRDSAIAYASRLWANGSSCELHVWPGMYHGGHAFEADVHVSKTANAAQKDFLDRVFVSVKGASAKI
ncbi:hypothetical protein HBI07_172350 [Parastagonospora nodorum]|nr:hypothetical protein HBI07_172350 [Parastagonospora nodorum]